MAARYCIRVNSNPNATIYYVANRDSETGQSDSVAYFKTRASRDAEVSKRIRELRKLWKELGYKWRAKESDAEVIRENLSVGQTTLAEVVRLPKIR